MGALNYNLRKLNHSDPAQRAKLLDTNFSSLEKLHIMREVELIRELRPNLNRYVYHTSLNFPKDEDLPDKVLVNIAHQYLEANGFTNNQFLIFRHNDADHPHLHLLVNRITFEGQVVSDSNNYKRSEQILRGIEVQYNLVQLSQLQDTQIQDTQIQSNRIRNSRIRAATKDELEMVMRTGKPSAKMVLQEKMNDVVSKSKTVSELISNGQKTGINFLFNLQSTGRISGITYFYGSLKITGQKLGNNFKWAELIKQVNYEQIRDGKAIGEANSRTRALYGDLTAGTSAEQQNNRNGSHGFYTGSAEDTGHHDSQSAAADQTGTEDQPGRERSLEAGQDADLLADDAPDFDYNRFDGINIQIADDEDDNKYRRRSRRTGR